MRRASQRLRVDPSPGAGDSRLLRDTHSSARVGAAAAREQGGGDRERGSPDPALKDAGTRRLYWAVWSRVRSPHRTLERSLRFACPLAIERVFGLDEPWVHRT